MNATLATDPAIRKPAEQAVTAAVDRGDPVFIQQLVRNLAVGTHADRQRGHALLQRYTHNVSPIPTGFAAVRDAEVNQYWRSWWTRNRQPGVAVSYFRDEPAGTPLQVGTEPGFAAVRMDAVPTARAVRLDAVVDVAREGVYLLTLRRGGLARAWLDGLPQDFTDDGAASGVQVARLMLPPGEHLLRVECRARSGGPVGPEARLVGVVGGDQDGVRLFSHQPPTVPSGPPPRRASPLLWLGALALMLVAWGLACWRASRLPAER